MSTQHASGGISGTAHFISKVWPFVALVSVTLAVGFNLLRGGWFVSGDGLHHLHRVAALTRSLLQGVLYPRWVGDFAFGYGVPVFNFYSPLSYYMAQLFAPLGATWAMKLTMLVGLFASALFLYRFAYPHVGRWPALIAAILYISAPYRLVDLFPRAALAEHMAFLWLPLILWSFDGVWTGRRWGWQIVGWAGLVLTHSFTALMFAPFFGLYVLWSAWRRHSFRPLVGVAFSLLLALGLTAFFWLPLGLEARYAGLGTRDDGNGYRNHLVHLPDLVGPILYDYGTGAGRTDYYYAFGAVSIAVLLLSIVGTVCLAITRRRARQRRDGSQAREAAAPGSVFLPTFGIVICLAALFLVSQASQPLWDALAPILAPIQFPWRFLGIATLGLALASTGLTQAVGRSIGAFSGDAGRKTRRSTIAMACLAVLIAVSLLLTGLARLPFKTMSLAPLGTSPEGLWLFDRDTGQAGTTWGGEFLPVGVREQRWALGRAPETPRDGPVMPQVAAQLRERRADGFSLDVDSAQPWTFRLHAFYFPGWQVRVDGAPIPTAASGDLGLVTAEIPGGQHRLSVAFETTLVRSAGKALTALCLILVLVRVWWPLKSTPRRRFSAGFWIVAVVVMLYVIVPALPGIVRPTPVQARFGDRAQMVGVVAPSYARPGQTLSVEIYWLASRENSGNDKSFVHLVDSQGQIAAQGDSDPAGGFTPTSRWQPGELLQDRLNLALPASLAPGRYRLKGGLYRFEPFQNLLTDPATSDGRVDLGEVVIE